MRLGHRPDPVSQQLPIRVIAQQLLVRFLKPPPRVPGAGSISRAAWSR